MRHESRRVSHENPSQYAIATVPPEMEPATRPPVRPFLVALGVVTALRVFTAASVPLSGDEAYYWTWTQHLALGYHDHPPMVAWIAALSTSILGSTTLAVRLPFVLMGTGVAWLSFILGWDISRSPRGAAWAGSLPLMVPLFTVAGVGVFPDSPLLLACAGFFVCAWRAVTAPERARWWLGAGACAGAAVMSKLTGLYLLPTLFTFLALSPPHRRLLMRVGPWLAVGAALVMASPFIYWNVTHHFESLAYQFASRLGSGSAHHSLHTPGFVLLSAVAVSPILYAMLVWATLSAGWNGWRGDARLLYVFCMAAPLHVAFLIVSIITKVGLHWTAPGTLASFSAFGAWMSVGGSRLRRAACALGVALAVAVSGLVYFFSLDPSGLVGLVAGGMQISGVNQGRALKTQEITEILGYPQMGDEIRAMAEKARPSGSPPFLFTTSYALSSTLWFYSGEPFHVVMGTRMGAQYDHWDDFGALLGRDALYIDTCPIDTREDVWTHLHEAFEGVTLEPPIVTHGRGVEARTFYVARCRRFRYDVFTPMKSIHLVGGVPLPPGWSPTPLPEPH